MTGIKTNKPTLLLATLFTCLGIIILCSLGTWQIHRLTWKNNILQKLDYAYKNPITDPDMRDYQDTDFIVAKIKGSFLFEKSILLGHSIQNEKPGQFLITPLKTKHGTILVNLGFNPKEQPLKEHALNTYNNKDITFSGIIRQPSWNVFTPQNSPENDIWYRLDIEKIATEKDLKDPVSFVIYADSSSPQLSNNLPNNTRWQPNNNHMQYALFWFSLAGTLGIIYYLRFIKTAKS